MQTFQAASRDKLHSNFSILLVKTILIILGISSKISDIFGIIKLLKILSFKILIHFGLYQLYKDLFNKKMII
jgi:hypothetical protein